MQKGCQIPYQLLRVYYKKLLWVKTNFFNLHIFFWVKNIRKDNILIYRNNDQYNFYEGRDTQNLTVYLNCQNFL